jgi:glucose-1-phosphate thymidylyltransferase
MKIIVPMAGKGKRMRPHTLTTPKPLIPIAGKSIVQRLVEDIAEMCDDPIEEVAYIIGDFGEETEKNLKKIASDIGAKPSIYYQEEALGTAHAILCAAPSLEGNVVIAFADTLFQADFKINPDEDGIVYTKKIENPSAFGVVVTDKNNIITRLVEKPAEFVSDLAIIGIYYFKDGQLLRDELQYLIDNNIKDKGEFQLTNAMENMKDKGKKLKAATVNEWMDCGNKNATVDTNKRILALNSGEAKVSPDAEVKDSVIIQPSYIGPGTVIKSSVIGPYASIGKNSVVERSIVSNSIIMENCRIKKSLFENSLLGNHVEYTGKPADLSLGDFCKVTI